MLRRLIPWTALAALVLFAQRVAGQGFATRTINVCVLSDAQAPVDPAVMERALYAVSAEYQAYAGITFLLAGSAYFTGDLMAWPIDQGPKLARLCPQNAELRILFTNQRVTRAQEPVNGCAGNPGDEFAAVSQDYFGFIIAFNADARERITDRGGHPALETTLKHEMGHLFQIDHSLDLQSFMYRWSQASLGLWTQEAATQLYAHRGKTWFPISNSFRGNVDPAAPGGYPCQ